MVIVFVFVIVCHVHFVTEKYLHPSSTGIAVQAHSRHHSVPLEGFVGVLLDEILSSNLDQQASHLIQNFIALVLLVVCSVAINLIHANLIRFERIDQVRVLSRLTLDFVCLVVFFAIAVVNLPSAGIVMFTFCVTIFRVLSHLFLSVRNCSLEGVHDIHLLGLGLAQVLRLFWSLGDSLPRWYPTPRCDLLGCVHPRVEGFHRGLVTA